MNKQRSFNGFQRLGLFLIALVLTITAYLSLPVQMRHYSQEIDCRRNLRVQAERGQIEGNFSKKTVDDTRFVHAPADSGNFYDAAPEEHRARYCFHIRQEGHYQIHARVQGLDMGSDSFWVQVNDGQPSVWDIEIADGFVDAAVTERDLNEPKSFWLSEGDHLITIYQREDEARLDQLELVPTSVEQPADGLVYAYYEVRRLESLPDFFELTPNALGVTPNFDIELRRRDNDFAFLFSGSIYLPQSGNYTFYLNSDDGSKLYIDDVEIVDNDGLHGPQERSGSVDLDAGKHDIAVTYFDRKGEQLLEVSIAGPNLPKQQIPDELLSASAATATPPAETPTPSSTPTPSVTPTLEETATPSPTADPTGLDPTLLPVMLTDFLLVDNDDDGFASPGDTLLYRIQVENRSDQPIEDIQIQLPLDPNTLLIPESIVADDGQVSTGPNGNTVIVFSLPSIPSTEEQTLSIQVQIKADLQSSEIRSQAAVDVDSQESTIVKPLIVSDDPDTTIPNDPTISTIGRPIGPIQQRIYLPLIH